METSKTEPSPNHQPSSADDPAAEAATLDSAMGPFFDTATLSAWLGVSGQTIYRLKRQRVMLAITTSDRRLAFPAWQFNHAKEPLAALPEVLALLDPTDEDPVGSALWLNAPAKKFEGATPAELLWRGDQERVFTVARRIAAAWQT